MSGPGFELVSDNLWTMSLVRYTCCSAVSFLTCEWFLSLSFEVSTIWNSSTTFIIQLLYCISRYLGLIAVIADSVLVLRIHAVYTVDPKLCRWWFGSQALTTMILLFCLELLLTMRVLAIYAKARNVTIFLCSLLATKTIAMMTLAALTVQDYGFGSACLTETVPVTAIYICIMQMITQAVIWWLTVLRHWQYVRRNRFPIPLLHLVTRDGSWVFVLLTMSSAITLVASTAGFYGSSSHRAKYCQLIFPIKAAILSFSTCKIIINFQEFVDNTISSEEPVEGHCSDNGVQFTTLITSSA